MVYVRPPSANGSMTMGHHPFFNFKKTGMIVKTKVEDITTGHGSSAPGIELIFFHGEYKEGDSVVVEIRKDNE